MAIRGEALASIRNARLADNQKVRVQPKTDAVGRSAGPHRSGRQFLTGQINLVIDLSTAQARKQLSQRIAADVEAFCVTKFSEGPRTHLGASIIGHECSAYAWNTFRWINFEQFSGRMYRLFNRGHLEEARFVMWLEGIGFQVREVDPATQKQFRISAVRGHFGGSLDAMMKAPARYELPEDVIFLGEFKTHNAKSFAKLVKDGVQICKPQHYRQMVTYGKAYNQHYGLYLAVNKDTDDLWPEVVPLDYSLADDMYRKAGSIINSQTQAPKIARTKTFATCSYCNFSPFCHDKAIPGKNCRTCKLATPVDNAEWHCDFYKMNIPAEVIMTGCINWSNILA